MITKIKKTITKIKNESGFTITELLVVLVIIGILILIALPKLLPLVTKAKTTEAKINLKQIHMLQKSYKFEYDKYSQDLIAIGFEQEKLVSQGGTARYKFSIISTGENSFKASATSTVDFDNDGIYNVWEITEEGIIKETIPD